MLTVWAIDRAGVPRGTLEPREAKAVLRHNQVSTWVFTFPLTDTLVQRLGAGWSVLVTDGPIRFSGAIRGFQTDIDAAGATLTINGKTELHRLADRLVYPDPAQAAGSQGVARYELRGPAETVIKTLVDRNAGPGALAPRRSPSFTIEPTSGTSAQVSISERFSNLLEVAQTVAGKASLVFDAVREDDGQVVFRTWPARDLTRRVRIEATGSIKTEAPAGTAVIVAGQGEGEARTLLEKAPAPGEWGHRVELFKDRRDTDSADALGQAADEALAEVTAKNSATFDLLERPGATFGTDFDLGDTITLELSGAEMSEQVTSATVTWTPHGRTVTLGVGPEAEANTPAWSPRLSDLDTRLRRMERQ